MGDRIDLTNVGEKLIAESLARGSAFDNACNIDELHRRRYHTLGLHDGSQLIEPRVRHRDDADVGIDGAKRIVLRRNR